MNPPEIRCTYWVKTVGVAHCFTLWYDTTDGHSGQEILFQGNSLTCIRKLALRQARHVEIRWRHLVVIPLLGNALLGSVVRQALHSRPSVD